MANDNQWNYIDDQPSNGSWSYVDDNAAPVKETKPETWSYIDDAPAKPVETPKPVINQDQPAVINTYEQRPIDEVGTATPIDQKVIDARNEVQNLTWQAAKEKDPYAAVDKIADQYSWLFPDKTTAQSNLRWYADHYKQGGKTGINWSTTQTSPDIVVSHNREQDTGNNPMNPNYHPGGGSAAQKIEDDVTTALNEGLGKWIGGPAERAGLVDPEDPNYANGMYHSPDGLARTLAEPVGEFAPLLIPGTALERAGLEFGTSVGGSAVRTGLEGAGVGLATGNGQNDGERMLEYALGNEAFHGLGVVGKTALPEAASRVADMFRNHEASDVTPSEAPASETGTSEVPTTRKEINAKKVSDVQGQIDEITKDWQNGPKFNVVNTFRNLPKAVKEAMKKDGAEKAYGLVDEDGTVHIIANNIKDPDIVPAVVFHEALGHGGLKNLFQDDLDNTLTRLYNGNTTIKNMADAYAKDNPGLYKDAANPIARHVEEALAQLSESGQIKPSMINQLVAFVRNFARKQGWKWAENYTWSEVQHILSQAHDTVVNGDKTSSTFDGVRYMYTGLHGAVDEEGNFPKEVHEAFDRGNTGERYDQGSQVHKDTGWFVGPDGKWRTEISDDGAVLKTPVSKWFNPDSGILTRLKKTFDIGDPLAQKQSSMFLPDVLHHPKLFERYPELNNVRVEQETNPEYGGSFSPYHNTLRVNPMAPDHLGTVLHEIQHKIQEIEDFARGGNPDIALRSYQNSKLVELTKKVQGYYRGLQKNVERMAAVVADEIKQKPMDQVLSENGFHSEEHLESYAKSLEDEHKHYQDLIDDLGGHYNKEGKIVTSRKHLIEDLSKNRELASQAYDHLFGEVEARDTTNRMNLTDEERKQVTPYTSEDKYIEPKDYGFSNAADLAANKYMMPKPERAGSINLDKYSSADEAIKDYMKDVAEELPKSKSQTIAEIKEKKAALGLNSRKILSQGEGLSPQFVWGALDFLQDSANRINKMAEKITENSSDEETQKFVRAMAIHSQTQERVSNIVSNAGRVLRVLREENQSAAALRKALKEASENGGLDMSDPDNVRYMATLIKSAKNDPAKITKLTRDAFGPLPEDYLTSWHYAAMLSGYKSLEHNVVGHFFGSLLNNVNMGVAATAGSIGKRIGLLPEEALSLSDMKYRMFGYLNALTDASLYHNTIDSFKTSRVDSSNGAATWSGSPQLPVYISGMERFHSASYTFFGEIEKSANIYQRAVQAAKDGELTQTEIDAIRAKYKARNFRGAQLQSAVDLEIKNLKADNVTKKLTGSDLEDRVYKLAQDPSKDLASAAMRDANAVRFMGDGSLSKALRKFTSRPEPDDYLMRLVRFGFQNIVPFVNIAEQKFLSSMRFVPLLDKLDPFARAQWKEGIQGKQIVATRYMLGMSAITSAAMMGDDLDKLLEKHKDVIAEIPVLNLMKITRDAINNYKKLTAKSSDSEITNAIEGALSALSSFASAMQNETFMKSVGDYFVARSRGGASEDRYWGQQLQSWLPYSAAMREANGFIDPVKRDTTGENTTDTIRRSLQSVIPGLSQSLPERNDAYGRVMNKGEVPEETDPVIKEVNRLSDISGKKLMETVTKSNLSAYNIKDAERLQKYQKLSGRYIYNELKSRMAESDWKTLSVNEKIEEIQSIKKDMRKQAREELFGEDPEKEETSNDYEQ